MRRREFCLTVLGVPLLIRSAAAAEAAAIRIANWKDLFLPGVHGLPGS